MKLLSRFYRKLKEYITFQKKKKIAKQRDPFLYK